jgi:uncharacterized membrane protein (UPF0127 family)
VSYVEKTKQIVFLTSFIERLRGLLFMKPRESWFLFSPCKGVHTFGMRYAIDIAFLNREGVVLESFRGVAAAKKMKHSQASVVIERFESQEPWLDKGDRVKLGILSSPVENGYKR